MPWLRTSVDKSGIYLSVCQRDIAGGQTETRDVPVILSSDQARILAKDLVTAADELAIHEAAKRNERIKTLREEIASRKFQLEALERELRTADD